MVIGAGVRGGQVIGGVDELSRGRPVELSTGEPTEAGTPLLADHLGATLLQLGGLDPAEHLPGISAISALLEEDS